MNIEACGNANETGWKMDTDEINLDALLEQNLIW